MSSAIERVVQAQRQIIESSSALEKLTELSAQLYQGNLLGKSLGELSQVAGPKATYATIAISEVQRIMTIYDDLERLQHETQTSEGKAMVKAYLDAVKGYMTEYSHALISQVQQYRMLAKLPE